MPLLVSSGDTLRHSAKHYFGVFDPNVSTSPFAPFPLTNNN